jgi:tRNAThr (cytosine32-N3)-methyltransferase
MDAFARARELIDQAHAADPARSADGRAAELVYADRMESWVARLVPDASALLRLAARCQHLERWSVPRASFPEGKVGYLTWRRSLYTKQAERARELLLAAGVVAEAAADVATWVSKTGLKTNAGTQALEDAACLVFLENEIGAFAAQHADYPRDKFIDILRKTWRKMSPGAQQAALQLDLPPRSASSCKPHSPVDPAYGNHFPSQLVFPFTMLKRAALLLFVVFVGVQFYRPEKNVSAKTPGPEDFLVKHNAPAEVRRLSPWPATTVTRTTRATRGTPKSNRSAGGSPNTSTKAATSSTFPRSARHPLKNRPNASTP